MPMKSAKQRAFFEGIAHGLKPKGGKGPSQTMAKKFIADSKESGNPALDQGPNVRGPIFAKGPIASAGKHPRAGGKRK